MLSSELYILHNKACSLPSIFSNLTRIESISKGQYEAGQVLGLSKSQIFFKVVLMQVVKRIIPPMSNEVITLVKDTSIARMMELFNTIRMYLDTGRNSKVIKNVMEKAAKLIAPAAPHISEYYWEKLGGAESIFNQSWPEIDKAVMKDMRIKIPVQVNSKNVVVLEVEKGSTEEQIKQIHETFDKYNDDVVVEFGSTTSQPASDKY